MGLFFKKRTIYIPTVYTIILVLLTFIGLLILFVRSTYSFLSPQIKPASKTLVIEGWIPETGLKNALEFFENNNYEHMIITGVPITQWTYSSPFSNMADASAGSLKQMFFRDTIYRAIIPSTIYRDRTYGTAISLKMQFPIWGISSDTFDLYSMGAHARRSYLMFSKAFPNARIGMITDTDPSFDHKKWWTSSRGFRTVSGEFISFVYSYLLFDPDEEQTKTNILEGHYIDSIISERFKTDREFADSLTSPLGKSDLLYFRGLKYFAVDKAWKIKAKVVIDTTEAPFPMPTTTDRMPLYRKYAQLTFSIGDSTFRLFAYQNLDYKKKHPDYNQLFLPFKDLTNTHETYGGGRYLDIPVPSSDSVYLDFNKCYNPYCAYHERWSCPLPPFENHLKTSIRAGVMKYKSTH